MNDSPQHIQVKPAAFVILIFYLAALVIGTHVPHPEEHLDLGNSDKLLHLTAYAGLAFLSCLNWSLRRRPAWWHWLVVVVLIAVFGALDEITQIPVGRDCDLLDWYADVTGATAATLCFAIGRILWRRTTRATAA